MLGKLSISMQASKYKPLSLTTYKVNNEISLKIKYMANKYKTLGENRIKILYYGFEQ